MDSNTTSFQEGLHMGTPEILGVIISIINITFVSLALYAIIWYERFGSNQNRTLINQFVTSACWIGIVHNIYLQISEVIISFGFPMPQLFCAMSLILKNTIIPICFILSTREKPILLLHL